MKKLVLLILCVLVSMSLVGCAQNNQTPEVETPVVEEKNETDTVSTSTEPISEYDGENIEVVTSASIVPTDFVQHYTASGFTDSDSEKVLMVIGDPRYNSVTYDLANTAMKHFEENGLEVMVRDLYTMEFNPVLEATEFYYAKDGFGEPSDVVKQEQEYVTQADYIVFVYPNWHDSEISIIKGYKETVFAKQFAYQSTDNGLEGKLNGKGVYTIMNAGFLGGGRGYIGDGVGIDDEAWDKYMNAYKVFDDDTAGFWGAENLGRFVNDRTPKNLSETYEDDINALRTALIENLNSVFLNK